MRRRYIFFDIDNTLVSHVGTSHVPPETREALRRLRDAGHVPAIATGRGGFLTRRVAEELGVELLVCADGAQLLNGEETLETSWLPEPALASFLRIAREQPAMTAALDEEYIYTLNDTGEFRDYFDAQAGRPCIRPLGEMRRALLCYLMAAPPLPGGCGIFSDPPEGVVLEHMRYFVEARAAGTSKWLGIRRVMERLGAALDDVIVFGDGPNDVEMLRLAPVGVAVGRACAAAKEAADLVAGDIDEGGILRACADLGLL